MATAEQFRRRLGVPEPDGADEQRAVLDRIAGRTGNGENPLLQFVSRSTVVSYASSARLEAVLTRRTARPKTPTRTAWPGGCG